MSSSHRERRNARLLLTARGVRAFGDGFVSILVPVYLTGIGFGAFEVGVLTTAMLLGPAMITLLVGLIAHRLKTVRLLATATALMALSGIGYAFETEFWPLLIIALVGTLSPTASDVSVFAPLEQTLLSNAVVPQRRTSIFATYSLIGSVLSAVGCLFASAPEIVARASLMPPNRALQGMFLHIRLPRCYCVYDLSSAEIAGRGTCKRAGEGSARPVAADRIYLGGAVQSRLVWRGLFRPVAARAVAPRPLRLVAYRSRLLVLLVRPPLSLFISSRRPAGSPDWPREHDGFYAPSIECLLDIGALRADARIRNSAAADKEHTFPDGCARTSYVMAVVTPPERPAAASVTAAPRSLAGAASPVIAGYLLALSSFGWPLVIGGSLNSLYDLLLLFMFRKVRPPEEQGLEDVNGDVSSTYHVADPSITPTRS
jgi:hypothetical protein